MKKLNAFDIFHKFENSEIDKASAFHCLKSIIESSENALFRIEALEVMAIIKPKDEDTFNFIENILLSDKHYQVRALAAKIMIENYPKRAFKPIKWALEKEKENSCAELITNSIKKSSNSNLKSLLNLKEEI